MPPRRDPDTEIAGSRPMTRAERWERDRVLCIPDLCMYRYACPVAGPAKRFVRRGDCFRCRPEGERPLPILSDYALRLLTNYRGE